MKKLAESMAKPGNQMTQPEKPLDQKAQKRSSKQEIDPPSDLKPPARTEPKTNIFKEVSDEENQFFQKPNLSRSCDESESGPVLDQRNPSKPTVTFERISIQNWDEPGPKEWQRERNGFQRSSNQSDYKPRQQPAGQHSLHEPASKYQSSQPQEDYDFVRKSEPSNNSSQYSNNEGINNPRSQPNRFDQKEFEQPQRNHPRQNDRRANHQNWGNRTQKNSDWHRGSRGSENRSGYRDNTIADIKRDKKQELKSVYKLLSDTVQSLQISIGADRGPQSVTAEGMKTILEEFDNRMRDFREQEDHKESNVLEDHKNFGNYFQKKKQNLIDNYKVFLRMHEDFIFPSNLQRKNNYRQYSEELPIYAKKIEFIKAIQRKRVIIFKSNPGSGKSTQLPQYLLDCIKGRILITEPRVIAVEGVARRVIEVPQAHGRRCLRSEKTERSSSRGWWATSEARTTTSTPRT